jgi:hypothetical protein
MSVPVGYPAALATVVVAVPIGYPVAWTRTIASTWKWAQTDRFRAATTAHTWGSP